MSDEFDSLDDLYAQARAQITKQAIAKAAAIKNTVVKKTLDPVEQATKLLFSDPKNWERTRCIALIHEETETVLGNFSEYLHLTVAGCRRLVRESTPMIVTGTERVSGNWWVPSDWKAAPRRPWHEQRQLVLHLHLSHLGLHAPACSINVFTEYGSIARVELAADSQLANEGEPPAQLVWLPAGTNVLDVMSQDSKIAVKIALGQQE